MELSWIIDSVTENDYDDISETVKRVIPCFDSVKTDRVYFRDNSETDADSKTAIKTDLTDKGYTWTSEV